MFDPVLTRYSDGRAHDHGPVSKRILRETVDVTMFKDRRCDYELSQYSF